MIFREKQRRWRVAYRSPLRRTFSALVGGLLLLLSLSPLSPLLVPAQGAEWEVPSAAMPELRSALRKARPGDVLRLAAGVYRGPFRVTKPLTLRPASGAEGRVVLEGGGRGRVLEIRAGGVTVMGLTVRGSGDNIEKIDACIYVSEKSPNAVLAGNQLEKCLFGIWVNGARGFRIENNTISGIYKKIASDRGNGINLWHTKNAKVIGNVIREVRDGILISVSTHLEVRGNFARKVRFGIHFMYNDRTRITGNLVCDSKIGLALMFSKRLVIADNVVIANRQQGILFRSIFDSKIRGNRAIGNAKGFFFNDASFNEITGNLMRENGIGVHVTAASEDNRIYGNNFIANPIQVKFSQLRPVYWDDRGRGNFWSDYLGWDMDRDGVGDSRYYASNRMDVLLYRYPQLKLLAASPLVRLMQFLESRFPVLRPAGVIDRRPAMKDFPMASTVSHGMDANRTGAAMDGAGSCTGSERGSQTPANSQSLANSR